LDHIQRCRVSACSYEQIARSEASHHHVHYPHPFPTPADYCGSKLGNASAMVLHSLVFGWPNPQNSHRPWPSTQANDAATNYELPDNRPESEPASSICVIARTSEGTAAHAQSEVSAENSRFARCGAHLLSAGRQDGLACRAAVRRGTPWTGHLHLPRVRAAYGP
jgi:hypothetical protein